MTISLSSDLYRFLLVGGLAAAVDFFCFLAVFDVLHRAQIENAGTLAKSVSVSIALLVAYLGHDRWTFNFAKLHGKASKISRFVWLYGLASLIQIGLIGLGTTYYDNELTVAAVLNGAVIGITSVGRYFAAKFLIFARRTSGPTDGLAVSRVDQVTQ